MARGLLTLDVSFLPFGQNCILYDLANPNKYTRKRAHTRTHLAIFAKNNAKYQDIMVQKESTSVEVAVEVVAVLIVYQKYKL